ncbi:LytR C-terminal domain-containing protein [Janibacter terrae]|jgi:hypothetical protein|uniref:LytR C-terminal domain-containing protein n=2 Tax=Janibacter terrae TaxID=103817 RepID=A0ABZ2FB57_9MICO|nr:LytR family transcriptional regulator [Janibacter terrae]
MAPEDYGMSNEARGRRRRAVVTILLVLLLIFYAAWYALSYIRADTVSRQQAAPVTRSVTCTTSPKQVEVNVYNATNRDGLAARVASDLKARGFTVKTVANDPKKRKVTGRGQLRYGSAGAKGAKLVALHVGHFEKLADSRARTTVDVVLGPDFTRLASESRIETC